MRSVLSPSSRDTIRPLRVYSLSPGSLSGFGLFSASEQANRTRTAASNATAPRIAPRLYGSDIVRATMPPEKTFENRVGIVTGGATGIGFAIARELARL